MSDEVTMHATPEWVDRIPLEELLAQSRTLPREFYARDTVEVARDLLGTILIHEGAAGRIVETEAYLGPEDLAAHASRGVTNRTRVLFGPPGHAYVYFIYGKHECLNLVAQPEGTPGCVLIRALEPLAGIAEMKKRRPAARSIEDLASGPGKLTAALNITRRHYGADVTQGSLIVRECLSKTPFEIVTTPRIGIRHCSDWPLRFIIAGNRFVSR
ncbi:MAG TPA: DNA-3-methyladenine glycosylase [Bryobacteraceae bacterium]|nr:DNA-3-methyladenine glycosylase [Bryobacteraceae bacterium]